MVRMRGSKKTSEAMQAYSFEKRKVGALGKRNKEPASLHPRAKSPGRKKLKILKPQRVEASVPPAFTHGVHPFSFPNPSCDQEPASYFCMHPSSNSFFALCVCKLSTCSLMGLGFMGFMGYLIALSCVVACGSRAGQWQSNQGHDASTGRAESSDGRTGQEPSCPGPEQPPAAFLESGREGPFCLLP